MMRKLLGGLLLGIAIGACGVRLGCAEQALYERGQQSIRDGRRLEELANDVAALDCQVRKLREALGDREATNGDER